MNESDIAWKPEMPIGVELVERFKLAAMALGELPVWQSADTHRRYQLYPVDILDEQIDFASWYRQPHDLLAGRYNVWILESHVRYDDSDRLQVNRYIIGPTVVGRATAESTTALYDPDVNPEFLMNALRDDLGASLEAGQTITDHDYANIYNALHDLEPAVSNAMTARAVLRAYEADLGDLE